MQSKILGRTGLPVSIVGIGTAFLGMSNLTPQTGNNYEALVANIDEDLGIQTIIEGIEAGSTLIDTAALYGGGRSESMIGRALAQRPDLAANVTVTTKVGRTIDGYDFSHDAILASIEASQRRLGIERFKVVYIHDAMGVPWEKVMGKGGALHALRDLQAQGIVEYIGTASDDPKTNTPYIETGEFDAAVVPRAWSLLNQLAAERILPAAVKHNVGLVIATPLERGILATGPIPGTYYFDRNFTQACQDHVGKIKALCDSHNIPLVAASLQWCVRHPQIAATIPGARFPQEAVENAQAGAFPIPESFWEELAPLVTHWDEGVHR